MKKTPVKSFRVKKGRTSVTVYSHAKGWRFAIEESGKRRYVTRAEREDIVEAARSHLKRGDGEVEWWSLSAGRRRWLSEVHEAVKVSDESAVLALLASRKNSISLGEAAQEYLLEMSGKAVGVRRLNTLRGDLQVLVNEVNGDVGDVTFEVLRDWVLARVGTAGAARYTQVRAAVVQFWRWARKRTYVDAGELTVADRLPTRKVGKGNLVVISRSEFEAMLSVCPDKYKLWLWLCGWAGMRPEEAAPSPEKIQSGKRGLAWEDLDFEFNVIRVSAEISKVGVARIVPLCAALRDVLMPLRGSGAICQSSPLKKGILKKLAVAAFGKGAKWPQDCLRHTYGSARNALIRNLDAVFICFCSTGFVRLWSAAKVPHFISLFGGVMQGVSYMLAGYVFQ